MWILIAGSWRERGWRLFSTVPYYSILPEKGTLAGNAHSILKPGGTERFQDEARPMDCCIITRRICARRLSLFLLYMLVTLK